VLALKVMVDQRQALGQRLKQQPKSRAVEPPASVEPLKQAERELAALGRPAEAQPLGGRAYRRRGRRPGPGPR
jgi:hypothetical protein